MIPQVHPQEAHDALGAGVLLDVREQDEVAQARVAGATWIPLMQVPERYAELPRDKPIYCLCAAGARSQSAAMFLAQHGFDARNIQGGIMAWHRLGLPLEHD